MSESAHSPARPAIFGEEALTDLSADGRARGASATARGKLLGSVWGRLLVLMLGVGVTVGTLYLLRHPILRGFGVALTHVDPLVESDLLVVLSGGEESRPFYAAELFAGGVAPRIAIVTEIPKPTERLGLTPNLTDVAVSVMRNLGVPDSAIVVLAPTEPISSTRAEAVVIRDYLAGKGIERVTIVTSPFHTARARYTFRKALEGLPIEVRMASAPEWSYDSDRWWESETGISNYGMEVLKWMHTLRMLN